MWLGLDVNLNEFSSASGDLSTRCWDLISWARSCGHLDDLVRSAHAQNPKNAKLAELVKQWVPVVAPDASDPTKLPVNTVVCGNDRYVVEALLGQGALGTLYRVRESQGGPRALKILSGFKHLGDARALERLQEDAKVGSRLGDRARSFVVDVKEVNVDRRFAGGFAFLIMDLLNGCQLDAALADEGRLAPQRVLDLVKSLAIVLDDAAQKGIVHGDLKPSNLFLHKISDDVQVLKVMDFGVARALGDARFSELGRMTGTPLFAAPELWGLNKPTAESDRWSLALLTFYALTGGFYWRASTFAALAVEVTSGSMAPASARAHELGVPLPPGFDAWFARCSHRTPSSRFETAHAAYVALRDAVQWVGDRSKLLAPVGPAAAEVAWSTRELALVPTTVGQGLDERVAIAQALRPGAVLEMLRAVAVLLPQYREYGARDPLMPSCIRYVSNKEGVEHVRLSNLNASGLAAAGDGKARTASIVFDVRVLGYIRPDLRSGVAVDDVWAIARVAFFALTGVSHVPTERVEEALRAAEVDTRPSERAYTQGRLECLPQGFDEWFARCSAKGPDPLRSIDDAVAAFASVAQAPMMDPVVAGGVLAWPTIPGGVPVRVVVPEVPPARDDVPPLPPDPPIEPVDFDLAVLPQPPSGVRRLALGAAGACLVVGAVIGAASAWPKPPMHTSPSALASSSAASSAAPLAPAPLAPTPFDADAPPSPPPAPFDAGGYTDTPDATSLTDAALDTRAARPSKRPPDGVRSPHVDSWSPASMQIITPQPSPARPPNPYEQFRPY